MSRFTVVDDTELKEKWPDQHAEWYSAWDDYAYFLVDTASGKVIYNDGGEPEDMTLGRDLGFFVDMMNDLAQENVGLTEELHNVLDILTELENS